MLDNESTATRQDGSVVRVIAETPELLAEGVAAHEAMEPIPTVDIDTPDGPTTGQALDMGDDRIQTATPEVVTVTSGLTTPSTADVVAEATVEAATPEVTTPVETPVVAE